MKLVRVDQLLSKHKLLQLALFSSSILWHRMPSVQHDRDSKFNNKNGHAKDMLYALHENDLYSLYRHDCICSVSSVACLEHYSNIRYVY